MIAIETIFTIIYCTGGYYYYYYVDSSESYPKYVSILAIMVCDVRDHTFSSLDCIWSLRKVFILPRA